MGEIVTMARLFCLYFMPDIRFQPLTGFRDFAPAECALRNYLFETWKRVAHRYGFVEYEAPTLEATELYLKKTGGELPTQLFRFEDQGGRDVTLRPELTASLARIAAGYQREYVKPLKWFEIGSCFRYEKPQKGRLREFYQFNADILGEASTHADAELLALAIDCMREMGFQAGDFIVRVSDREAWLGFASRHGVSEEAIPTFLGIVDKLERDRAEDTDRKLAPFGLKRADLEAFIAAPPAGASQRYETLFSDLEARGLSAFVKLDLSIVRGLAYYTGLVFEIFDTSKNLRAVAGGGRYDTLIGALSDQAVEMPATGFAMGDVVIAHLIEQTPHAKALLEAYLAQGACDIYLVWSEESQRKELLALASQLRDLGYRIDYGFSPVKMGAQFQKAEKIGARYALVLPVEAGASYEFKTLSTRQAQTLTWETLLETLETLFPQI